MVHYIYCALTWVCIDGSHFSHYAVSFLESTNIWHSTSSDKTKTLEQMCNPKSRFIFVQLLALEVWKDKAIGSVYGPT